MAFVCVCFCFFCQIGAFVFLNLPVGAKVKFHLKTELMMLNTCEKMLNSGTKKQNKTKNNTLLSFSLLRCKHVIFHYECIASKIFHQTLLEGIHPGLSLDNGNILLLQCTALSLHSIANTLILQWLTF